MLSGFPPEFTLAKAGAGMTTFYENITLGLEYIYFSLLLISANTAGSIP